MINSKYRWVGYAIVVAFLHLLGAFLISLNSQKYPQMIQFAFLAYVLGLRHAFDADHIAAIDNTVRKLIQHDKDPTGVGFFFSMGHSSVVFIMVLVTACSMQWAQHNIPVLQNFFGVVGASVSAGFLILIGILNLYVWLDLFRIFRSSRKGLVNEENIETILQQRGFISRCAGPFYRIISKSWHVYPLGFLFGLGFDTASEVALIAMSAGAVSLSVPVHLLLALPVIFAAGMSLMDTIDGIFMCTAYNWAFATPRRKMYYNLSVTGISVVAALSIGFFELIQLVAPKLGFNGAIWEWVSAIDISQGGYILFALFAAFWVMSLLIWKKIKTREG